MIESKATTPGELDQGQADQHAGRGEGVGAQVRRVALQRRRVVRPRLPREDRRDGEVGEHREAHHRDADPERVDLGPDHQPVGRLVDDDPGADQDQHPLDRRRQALDLLVAVGVLGVGRLVGFADRDEGDHRGDQVDQRVDRLGDDRDRAGDRPGGELERDQQRVGGDRERRRAAFRVDHRSAGAASPARCSASSRAARAAVADLVLLRLAQLRHRALVVGAGRVGDEGRVVAEAALAARRLDQAPLAARLEDALGAVGLDQRQRADVGGAAVLRPPRRPRAAASRGSPRRSRPAPP